MYASDIHQPFPDPKEVCQKTLDGKWPALTCSLSTFLQTFQKKSPEATQLAQSQS